MMAMEFCCCFCSCHNYLFPFVKVFLTLALADPEPEAQEIQGGQGYNPGASGGQGYNPGGGGGQGYYPGGEGGQGYNPGGSTCPRDQCCGMDTENCCLGGQKCFNYYEQVDRQTSLFVTVVNSILAPGLRECEARQVSGSSHRVLQGKLTWILQISIVLTPPPNKRTEQ